MKKGTVIITSAVAVLGVSAFIFRDKIHSLFIKLKDSETDLNDATNVTNPDVKPTTQQTTPKPAETPITPTSNIGVLNSVTNLRKYPTWNSSFVTIEYVKDGVVKTTTALAKSSSVKILESVTGFYKVRVYSNKKEFFGYIGKQFIDRF